MATIWKGRCRSAPTLYVSGKVEWFNGRPAMVHPDYIVDEKDFASLPLIEPVYPMTAGIARKTLARAVSEAVASLPELPEWLDPTLVAERGWQSFAAALAKVHHPETAADLDPSTPHIARLAYDELIASQLALALMREHQRKSTGKARKGDGRLRASVDGRPALHAHRQPEPRRSPTSRRTSPRRSACCACCRAMSARARRWWR